MTGWTFLTNHARVLVCIARQPDSTLRQIAACAEITERTTHQIVDELVESGYLTRNKLGRRNFYEVHLDRALRHPLEAGVDIGEFVRPFLIADRDSEAA